MLARRRFALGAAAAVAVAAAGAGGALAIGPDRVLHGLGLRDSPDHRVPTSGRPVGERALSSLAMGREVAWAIVVPPGPPVGVIVCLHPRGADHRMPFTGVPVHDAVADLGLALAVVAVDGGPDSYWHPRADGSDPMALVLDELLPAVDAELGVSLPRALLGWSMGGYGALLLAERAPQQFRAAVASSPALFASYGDASPGAFDSEADFAAHDVFARVDALEPVTVRVDCGDGDPFFAQSKRFAAALGRPNPGSFGRGDHDDPYWRSVLPAQLTTIAGALGA